MRYLLGIVLYAPDLKQVENIKEYIGVFDEIVIFDNSSDNEGYIDLIKTMDKVVYFTQSVNQGLSVAYNYFLKAAIDKKCDWLCTLDQDSDFSIKSINVIKDYITCCSLSNVGIVVPKVDVRDNSNLGDNNLQVMNQTDEVSFAISSGMFINTSVLKQNNLRFDEKYFIDRVDADICKQILLSGNKIIKCNNSILKQKLGEDKNHSHSATRHYYISRNRWYYNKQYYNIVLAFMLSLVQTIKHIWLVIIYEKQKIEKVNKINLGIRDFFLKSSGKMGE